MEKVDKDLEPAEDVEEVDDGASEQGDELEVSLVQTIQHTVHTNISWGDGLNDH